MSNFKDQLIQLNACDPAIEFVADKTFSEAYEQCERGDWLLWLYKNVQNYDKRKLVLAAGLCANTVRHLMKDERSIKAVDAAINYGNGLINDIQLTAAADAAADAAAAAADAAYAYAYAYAAYAAYAADAAAAAYAAYAYAAYAYAAAAYAYAARLSSQKQTAEIVKSIIKKEDFNINF